jgi:hypothetical protein
MSIYVKSNGQLVIPDFPSIKERLDFLYENKQSVISLKRNVTKEADALHGATYSFSESEGIYKANTAIKDYQSMTSIKTKLAINAIGLIDSHTDLHLNGIWNKSVRENKYRMHLQEHKMQFDKIISDGLGVTAMIERYTWKALGQKYTGDTEVLVYESVIDSTRNPFMFEQYAKGYVRNHSVGMRYVTIYFCVNSEEKYWSEEKANWDKYLPFAVNPEVAEDLGYFFAVKEAKEIEGSAVVMGSNVATPTIENNIGAEKITPEEPPKSTQFNVSEAINKVQFKI